jgi:lipoate-protein ligase B
MTEPVQSESPLEIIDLGRRSYEEVYALQQERLQRRIDGTVGDAVFLVEHEHVITRGRRSAEDDVTDVPFPVVSIERGGEATYHGPGQLVAYPILFLPEGRRDLHRYLRDLEQAVIECLGTLGIEGRREEGLTGVWIGTKKVCSIGVAVRRWVTWHGLALNVTTDMGAFEGFAPCGLSAEVMTRVQDELETSKSPSELMVATKNALVGALNRGF